MCEVILGIVILLRYIQQLFETVVGKYNYICTLVVE